MRRTDTFGLLGLVMLVVGVVLFLQGSAAHLSWVYWVGGPALWFFGFATLVGWMVLRWGRSDKEEESTKKQAPNRG
jgi:hypothetical protein